MQNLLDKKDIIDLIIRNALLEDIGEEGDITTDLVIKESKISKFELYVNEDAVFAGGGIFRKTFESLDKNLEIKLHHSDGDEILRNTTIATIVGDVKNILKGERTALNFLGHLSGIATLTREMVNLIQDTDVVLLDTRKTTPGLRLLEKEAVCLGGGKNHRLDLSSEILIKDNHIKQVGSVSTAIKNVREKKQERIIVEVQNLNELKEAIESGVDIILFDNWKPACLRDAIKSVPENITTEASGNITLANLKEFALTGVDRISTSYMIKYSKWVDFSLELVG